MTPNLIIFSTLGLFFTFLFLFFFTTLTKLLSSYGDLLKRCISVFAFSRRNFSTRDISYFGKLSKERTS